MSGYTSMNGPANAGEQFMGRYTPRSNGQKEVNFARNEEYMFEGRGHSGVEEEAACYVCNSTRHWEYECPHRDEEMTSQMSLN